VLLITVYCSRQIRKSRHSKQGAKREEAALRARGKAHALADEQGQEPQVSKQEFMSYGEEFERLTLIKTANGC